MKTTKGGQLIGKFMDQSNWLNIQTIKLIKTKLSTEKNNNRVSHPSFIYSLQNVYYN